MINKILVAIVWLAALLAWILKGISIPFLILVIMHGSEIFLIGLKTGKKQGISPFKAAILTFCFGIAWWWPLRRKP